MAAAAVAGFFSTFGIGFRFCVLVAYTIPCLAFPHYSHVTPSTRVQANNNNIIIILLANAPAPVHSSSAAQDGGHYKCAYKSIVLLLHRQPNHPHSNHQLNLLSEPTNRLLLRQRHQSCNFHYQPTAKNPTFFRRRW